MIIINTHTDGAHAAAHRTLASIPDPASEVRWHAVRGAAPAAHASEAQSHGPGFCSLYGDECLGGSKLTTPRPASSIGSPSHGSEPSGPRPPMMLGISRCGRRSSARHWVWRCRYSPPSPAATNVRPPCAAVRSTGWTFSATTRPPAPRTLAQPKRTTGPSEF